MPRDATLVLIACCLAMLSVGENSTAIMAALPEMTRSLDLGPATVEWAVNAYLLASAVFIILGGEAALLDLVIVLVAAIVPVIYAMIVFPRRDLAAPA